MDSTKDPTFVVKCPFCAKEFKCRGSFKIRDVNCFYCERLFTLRDYQSEKSHIKKLEDELAQSQECIRKL